MSEQINDQKVKSLFADLTNIVAETGLANQSKQFADAMRELPYANDLSKIKFRISYAPGVDHSFFAQATAWITGAALTPGETGEKSVHTADVLAVFEISPFENITTTHLGDAGPAVFFAIIGSTDPADPEFADKLSAYSSVHPYIILLSETGMAADNLKPGDHIGGVLHVETYTSATLPPTTFLARLEHPEFLHKMHNLVHYNALNSIESLYNVFSMLLEQENRQLTGRKATIGQPGAKHGGGSAGSMGETILKLRNELTEQMGMLEKGLADGFENYLRPQTGKLSQVTERLLADLPELAQSEKTKTISLHIPEQYVNFFLDGVFAEIHKFCEDQLITIRDAFKLTQQDLERRIERDGLPQVPFNFKPLTDKQLSVIMNSSVRIDKIYEGVLPKQGPMEYFNALKSYQAMLYLFASSLGLSYFEKARYITIPAAIVLIGICIYYIHKSVVQEYREAGEKEYLKAKENLTNEVKRMGGEIARQWNKEVSDHIKMQLTQVGTTIDYTLKEFGSKKQHEADDEKRRIEKLSQSFEAQEKKIAAGLKAKESFHRNFIRVRADLRQSVAMQLKKTDR